MMEVNMITLDSGKELQLYDLKFLVDLNTKFYNILDQIDNNISYNVQCSRNPESMSLQDTWMANTNEIMAKLYYNVDTLIPNHPVWEWASQLRGINGGTLGLIVGAIRFWPPKVNVVSSENSRERWAHSIGALLTFCGLSMNKTYHNNSHILEYITEQVHILTRPGNSYYMPYNKFISLQYSDYKNNSDNDIDLDEIDLKIEEQAFYNTCILFMKHVYIAVNEAIGNDKIKEENISLLMSHNDVLL